MSEENDNGSQPPDGGGQDKQALLRERLHKLQGLVLQHALPHVRQAVHDNLDELSLDAERIELIVDQVRDELIAQGEADDAVQDAIVAARENLEQMSRREPAAVEEVVGMALLDVAPKIVASWANVLCLYASRGGGIAWLRAAMLGDDMLPLGDKDCDEAFDEDFNEDSAIDGDTARAVLRDIRASLPAGKALPEDMVVALDLAWGITLVP